MIHRALRLVPTGYSGVAVGAATTAPTSARRTAVGTRPITLTTTAESASCPFLPVGPMSRLPDFRVSIVTSAQNG